MSFYHKLRHFRFACMSLRFFYWLGPAPPASCQWLCALTALTSLTINEPLGERMLSSGGLSTLAALREIHMYDTTLSPEHIPALKALGTSLRTVHVRSFAHRGDLLPLVRTHLPSAHVTSASRSAEQQQQQHFDNFPNFIYISD